MRIDFPNGELDRWACLGALTDRSVRVWLRHPGGEREASVEATLRTEDGREAHTTIACVGDHDWIGATELRLDEPAPDVRFEVNVAGQSLTGRFGPRVDAPASFTFGFGSCHQPFSRGEGSELVPHHGAEIYPGMRHTLLERDSRFLLLIGDQVYSDGVGDFSLRSWLDDPEGDRQPTDHEVIEAYRQLYRGYFNEPGFHQLLETFPSYLIWDDHDIFDSWGSRLSPHDNDGRLFTAAAGAFSEYQHPHNPATTVGANAPFDFSFHHGDVGFLVLDLRGERDWEAGRVIGEAQWERIDAFFSDAEAQDLTTVFVASSIPLIHFPPRIVRWLQYIPGGKGSDVRDRWDAAPFREQRDRLINRLAQWELEDRRRQVIVLSGDVHAGAAFHVRDQETDGQFEQWTSSSLSAPGGPAHDFVNKFGPRVVNWGEARCDSRLIGVDPANNFGVVEVQPLSEGGHRVTFDLMKLDAKRSTVRRAFHATTEPAAARSRPPAS